MLAVLGGNTQVISLVFQVTSTVSNQILTMISSSKTGFPNYSHRSALQSQLSNPDFWRQERMNNGNAMSAVTDYFFQGPISKNISFEMSNNVLLLSSEETSHL